MRLPLFITCSTIVCAYPISLSYHASTLTRFPSTTLVNLRSAMEANSSPRCQKKLNLLPVTDNIFSQRASPEAVLILLNLFHCCISLGDKCNVHGRPRHDRHPHRHPSNFPSNDVKAFVLAIAAPVEEGTMFIAAARPSANPFAGRVNERLAGGVAVNSI